MSAREEFVRMLESGDVPGLTQFWKVRGHVGDRDPETMMHMTRVMCESVYFSARAYSHAWLLERGLPSFLPDNLRPRAEQMHPRIFPLVGVSVQAQSPELELVAKEMEVAMANAAGECLGNGESDPLVIDAQMAAVRSKIMRQALGR